LRYLLKLVPTLALAFVVISAAPVGGAKAGDDSYAQYKLGMKAYSQGNYDEAIAIWQPLADHGYPAAQFNIGMLYQKGVGVERSLTTANAWFQKAVDRNFAPAQLALGRAYMDGIGVDQNTDRGLVLMTSAAEQGLAQAQYEVGVVYREGKIVQRDQVRALEYFLLAAEQGDPEAQYHAAFMYGSGYGAPQDFALAYMYYDMAAQTLEISSKARDHLAEYMTEEEMAEAQALIAANRTLASSGESLSVSMP
jgi:TPR repeat protein